MKDKFDALRPELQPGPLAPALGAHVEQFYALERPVPLTSSSLGGAADIWAEPLDPVAANVRVGLRYGTAVGSWLDGKAAMVTRPLGRGRISYLGTLPNSIVLAGVLTHAAHEAHVAAARFHLPDDVELCVRIRGTGKSISIVIKHGSVTEHVSLPGSYRNILDSDHPSRRDIPNHAHPTCCTGRARHWSDHAIQYRLTRSTTLRSAASCATRTCTARETQSSWTESIWPRGMPIQAQAMKKVRQ
jgi:beta-galactosidase